MKETENNDYDPDFVFEITQLPVFSQLHASHTEGMINFSKLIEYAPGEPVFLEGEYDNCFYVLISGTIRVSKDGVLLCHLRRAGEVFGEMSVTNLSERSASVYAESKCECLRVDMGYLETLSLNEKDVFLSVLYRNFVEVLTHRLKKTTAELVVARGEIARLKPQHAHPNIAKVISLMKKKVV
jgi:CRP-like cAMP-binding protein